jgi:hypothetical protein
MVVGGVVGWIGIHSGRFQLTDSTPLHMFNHMVYYRKLLDPEGPATQRLQAAVAPRDLREMGHWDVTTTLAAKGISWPDAVEMVGAATREAAGTVSFGAHFEAIARTGWNELFANCCSAIPTRPRPDQIHPEFENPPPLGVHGAGLWFFHWLQKQHGWLWPLLCWSMLAGIPLALFLRGRWPLLAISCLPVFYMLASAAVEFFYERYNAAITPIVGALAMVPLAVAWALIARLLGNPPPARVDADAEPMMES